VQASPLAFAALRYVGSAHLLYLAWQAFRSAATPIETGDATPAPLRTIYARAVTMNVTNPKVVIFFLGFLPQFADADRGTLIGQMLILRATFMACSLLWSHVARQIGLGNGCDARRAGRPRSTGWPLSCSSFWPRSSRYRSWP
jgi:threonine/homoserine/homoserine lactone efflux protein